MSQVLVVDDEPIFRRHIARILTHAGYNVTTAADGCEALKLLRQGCARIVVSDWSMPCMNGLELCRAIRSDSFHGYVYFIMVTSHDQPQDTVQGLEAGADDYVVKPFNPAELIMRVNTGKRIVGLETRDITIFSLAKLAESRDPETGAHLERVRSYCKVLALRLQQTAQFTDEIDNEYIRLIYETSPLHDIGKVAIPDCILLKPGRLTDREFALMKTHTLRGAETLQAAIDQFPSVRFLEMAREIAMSHHERWDGSGYPEGLVGDAIPLSARILALADVYDALTSKRVYKDAYGHDIARAMIVQDSGSHFDPDVVEAFLAEEQEFIAIRNRYTDSKGIILNRPEATEEPVLV